MHKKWYPINMEPRHVRVLIDVLRGTDLTQASPDVRKSFAELLGKAEVILVRVNRDADNQPAPALERMRQGKTGYEQARGRLDRRFDGFVRR